jgi:hypothetical protein
MSSSCCSLTFSVTFGYYMGRFRENAMVVLAVNLCCFWHDDLVFCEGCAFVKFAHRDMALAAIKGLNGTLTMRVKWLIA